MLKHADVVLLTERFVEIDGFHTNTTVEQDGVTLYVYTVNVPELSVEQTMALFNVRGQMMSVDEFHEAFPPIEEELCEL